MATIVHSPDLQEKQQGVCVCVCVHVAINITKNNISLTMKVSHGVILSNCYNVFEGERKKHTK